MSEEEHRGVDQREGSPEDARVLRVLVDELRAAPPPELDWDRIERGLVARIGERSVIVEASVEPTGSNPFWRRRRIASSLFVAVAAAAVLVISLRAGFFAERFSAGDDPRETVAAGDLAAVPQVDGAYRVGAMAPTTAIDSGDDPIRFTLPGIVNWTLAPRSRVVINTVAVPHRVTLERGRVDAEVVPTKGAPSEPGAIEERFAVIAGNTRVAVRGTVFSVERDEATITVEVTRGKVAVGAAQPESGAPIELLIGPARALFSLEGRLLARRAETSPAPRAGDPATEAPDGLPPATGPEAHRADIAQAAPPTPPDQTTAPRPGSSEPAPKPSVEPTDPADHPVRISVAAARGIVLGCLRQALASGSDEGPELTVSSAVTVTLGPEGRVDAVRFSPPLRPDLQDRCGGTLFGKSLDAEGKASFHVALSR
jgi:ferric-dicitrate binding protein FerR (iron transport regulator)